MLMEEVGVAAYLLMEMVLRAPVPKMVRDMELEAEIWGNLGLSS